VDGVESSSPPLCRRTGPILKSWIYDAKAPFSRYTGLWERSGQNDPERFRNFLPVTRGVGPSYPEDGELSAEGKRMLVIFTAFRCGTPHADTALLNMSRKVMPDSENAACEVGVELLEFNDGPPVGVVGQKVAGDRSELRSGMGSSKCSLMQ